MKKISYKSLKKHQFIEKNQPYADILIENECADQERYNQIIKENEIKFDNNF